MFLGPHPSVYPPPCCSSLRLTTLTTFTPVSQASSRLLLVVLLVVPLFFVTPHPLPRLFLQPDPPFPLFRLLPRQSPHKGDGMEHEEDDDSHHLWGRFPLIPEEDDEECPDPSQGRPEV